MTIISVIKIYCVDIILMNFHFLVTNKKDEGLREAEINYNASQNENCS
jgi:hypothetical protein